MSRKARCASGSGAHRAAGLLIVSCIPQRKICVPPQRSSQRSSPIECVVIRIETDLATVLATVQSLTPGKSKVCVSAPYSRQPPRTCSRNLVCSCSQKYSASRRHSVEIIHRKASLLKRIHQRRAARTCHKSGRVSRPLRNSGVRNLRPSGKLQCQAAGNLSSVGQLNRLIANRLWRSNVMI